MALFPAHLEQARKNIDFLKHINDSINDRYDWQVTVCYYVAVHLINGYLADKVNEHFRTHHDVSLAINPFNKGIAAVSDKTYTSFRKLQMLSRRSRYLIKDSYSGINPEDNCLTYSVHFSKSIRHLDDIMTFIEATYKDIELPKIKIKCIELKSGSLKHFDTV